MIVTGVLLASLWTCTPPLGSLPPTPEVPDAYVCTATIDTTTLTDGWHTLAVRATDASGGWFERWIRICVANLSNQLCVPPLAPSQLTIK